MFCRLFQPLRAPILAVAVLAAGLAACSDPAADQSAALKKDQAATSQLSQIVNGLNTSKSITNEAFATLKSLREKYPKAPEVTEVYKSALISRSDWGALEVLMTEKPIGQMTVDEREMLGRVYLRGGKYESAVEILKPLAASAPQNAEVRSMLGAAYNLLGRYDEAAAEIDAVWDRVVADKKVDSMIVRGTIHLNQKQFDKAEQILLEALKIAPENAMATNTLSRVYTWLGKPEKADEYRQRTVALHKKANDQELQAIRRVEKIYALDGAWKAKNYEEVIRLVGEVLPVSTEKNEKIVLYQYLYESNKALGRQAEAQNALAEAQKLQQQK